MVPVHHVLSKVPWDIQTYVDKTLEIRISYYKWRHGSFSAACFYSVDLHWLNRIFSLSVTASLTRNSSAYAVLPDLIRACWSFRTETGSCSELQESSRAFLQLQPEPCVCGGNAAAEAEPGVVGRVVSSTPGEASTPQHPSAGVSLVYGLTAWLLTATLDGGGCWPSVVSARFRN